MIEMKTKPMKQISSDRIANHRIDESSVDRFNRIISEEPDPEGGVHNISPSEIADDSVSISTEICDRNWSEQQNIKQIFGHIKSQIIETAGGAA